MYQMRQSSTSKYLHCLRVLNVTKRPSINIHIGIFCKCRGSDPSSSRTEVAPPVTPQLFIKWLWELHFYDVEFPQNTFHLFSCEYNTPPTLPHEEVMLGVHRMTDRGRSRKPSLSLCAICSSSLSRELFISTYKYMYVCIYLYSKYII